MAAVTEFLTDPKFLTGVAIGFVIVIFIAIAKSKG